MLSVILPSYKEPYLRKTIEGILENFVGDYEVIAVLDGYWEENVVSDKRVRYLHIGRNEGMRNAINKGVSIAQGDVIMKADAHCMFSKGFDEIKVGDGEVVIPRRYFLDPVRWEVMDREPVDYDKLIIMHSRNKFHGEEWKTRAKERKDIPRDETMSFQGSCWLMRRSWWDKTIGELEEKGYGKFVQEPTEIGMKTWSNGGRVLIEKRFWYAHKERTFKRTHNVKREEADKGNAYALNLWKDEYETLKKRFNVE